MTTRGWLSCGAAAALALSFLWSPSGLPGFDVCFFHRLTGLPCPGCGLTHSFCAISHGDFCAAWAYNPFGFLFYALAVILLLHPLLARRSAAYRRLVSRPSFLWIGAPALAVRHVGVRMGSHPAANLRLSDGGLLLETQSRSRWA